MSTLPIICIYIYIPWLKGAWKVRCERYQKLEKKGLPQVCVCVCHEVMMFWLKQLILSFDLGQNANADQQIFNSSNQNPKSYGSKFATLKIWRLLKVCPFDSVTHSTVSAAFEASRAYQLASWAASCRAPRVPWWNEWVTRQSVGHGRAICQLKKHEKKTSL